MVWLVCAHILVWRYPHPLSHIIPVIKYAYGLDDVYRVHMGLMMFTAVTSLFFVCLLVFTFSSKKLHIIINNIGWLFLCVCDIYRTRHENTTLFLWACAVFSWLVLYILVSHSKPSKTFCECLQVCSMLCYGSLCCKIMCTLSSPCPIWGICDKDYTIREWEPFLDRDLGKGGEKTRGSSAGSKYRIMLLWVEVLGKTIYLQVNSLLGKSLCMGP